MLIARRFFNDAVRDTRTLRARRMPRLLHLAGRRELPQFFDIDDSSLFAQPCRARPRLGPARELVPQRSARSLAQFRYRQTPAIRKE